MRQANFYSAVFAIIKNDKWEILFQKRKNTWYMDWFYQLPSWHLEWRETMKAWMIRELKEELGIDVLEKDLNILNISHRLSEQRERVYFNIYIEVLNYSWEITNNEPDKCEELRYISRKDFNDLWVVEYNLEILDIIKRGVYISEQKV